MRPRPIRAYTFGRPDDWAEWLESRHDKDTEVWLRLAKKKTGVTSIDADQAVEEALIWGWTDSTKKADEDDGFWLQRFTPRSPKSLWSQKARAVAERLIAGGWMQEAGLAEVAAAQADGRWDAAAPDVVEDAYPDDFIAALNAAPQSARNTLAGYDAKNRNAITYRLAAAKQPETRARRIEEFIAKLTRGEKFH
jgi:uncharacterized protein YdeI (YjbR/CyaY-like superfamily)